MTLTQEQKDQVREWAGQGAGLGEIQKRIAENFDIAMTYLEARLLVSELEVTFGDTEEQATAEASELESDSSSDVGEELEAFESPLSRGKGDVTVTVDTITQPNALVSGSVSFSDGQAAKWHLDQLGRLAIHADQAGYRPSEADLMHFQRQLQNVLRSGGF